MSFGTFSKYDDLFTDIFLDALYLWFGTTKLNLDHRRPRIPCNKVLDIIQRNILEKKKPNDAVAELLAMDYLKHYLTSKSSMQQREFVQHMKRYLYMYMPDAGYEIGDTRRNRGAGKRIDTCLIATKDWHAGDELRMCTGLIACLDPQQDMQLRKGNRDFRTMWSTRRGCSCLFLGPARFANHDCDSNCMFIARGQNSVILKVIKDIKCGDEITAYHGPHYFGKNNHECRCATCERRGEGAFALSGAGHKVQQEYQRTNKAVPRQHGRKRKSALYDDYTSEPLSHYKRSSIEFPSRGLRDSATKPRSAKRPTSGVMSIEFLCGRDASLPETNPLDLLCDAADAVEYLYAAPDKGLTVMVGDLMNAEDEDDRDDNSSDTKADSAVGMSPHVNHDDDFVDDNNGPWTQEMDTLLNHCGVPHDDDDDADDWFDDVSELSSIASDDLSLWSDDGLTDIATPEPVATVGKSKVRNTGANKPLECIACHRLLRRDEISEQVGYETSTVAELATWTWSPSALFPDWRPKRCPRCERHWTIFRQEWPQRKAAKQRKKPESKTPLAPHTREDDRMDDQLFGNDTSGSLTPLSDFDDDEGHLLF